MGRAIFVENVDWSNTHLGKVTPTGDIPVQNLYILGDNSINGSAQLEVAFYPVFTTQRDVSWSIVTGGQYAEISDSGFLTASASAGTGQEVTIKVVSTANPTIEGYRTFIVRNEGAVTYPDWLKSDGSCYFLIPGMKLFGGRLIVRGDLPSGNGYLFGSKYSDAASGARIGMYRQSSSGNVGLGVGDAGYLGTNKSAGTTVFRAEYQFSTSSQSGTNDGNAKLYNDTTDELLWTSSNTRVYLDGDISVFVLGSNKSGAGTPFTPGSNTYSASKFYGLKVYDASDNLIIDAVPALFGGTPCIHEKVSGNFLYNLGSGTLTTGNDE